MARNATNLLDRKNGYKASMDSSGNMTGSGVSGSYIQFGAVKLYGFSSAITENSTTTTAASGSIAFTTNATGAGKIFYSDGTKWQLAVATAAT